MKIHTDTNYMRRVLAVAGAALLFCASMQITPVAAQEQIRYITDVLYVPMRSGQGNEYRIINARMRSGTKLTLLEEGETGEWARVQTESGEEGWIRTQYLSANEPSRITLQKTQSEVAVLTRKNKSLTDENRELKKSNTELNSQATTASKQSATMAEELQSIKTLSANAIELEQRYTELLEKHQLLQTENDVLSVENEKLKNDNRVNFMIWGVGIFIFGIVMAYVIPALKPKKRYSDWS